MAPLYLLFSFHIKIIILTQHAEAEDDVNDVLRLTGHNGEAEIYEICIVKNDNLKIYILAEKVFSITVYIVTV